MKILISGATGLVGTALIKKLQQDNHSVTVLTRSPDETKAKLPGVETIRWDFVTPLSELPVVEAVVHLAGEPIFGKRWTAHQKEVLRSSRIVSTRELVNAIRQSKNPPSVFVCASAVGFYGDRGDEVLDEKKGPGTDFLAEICRDWEKEAALARSTKKTRAVSLRSGIVLAKEGGALSKMIAPFKMGAGGPIGNGKQWTSWIHLKDEVGLILHAIKNPNVDGPVNSCSPEPVINKEFAQILGEVLRRPAILPTPVLALRVLLGEVASVLTSSQRTKPDVAESTRYQYQFPHLKEALIDLQ